MAKEIISSSYSSDMKAVDRQSSSIPTVIDVTVEKIHSTISTVAEMNRRY